MTDAAPPGGSDHATDASAAIDASKYLNLETRRRNGTIVVTPIWFAATENAWYAYTLSDSGKVKRLRHTPAVRVCACDMKGKVSGAWIRTRAVLVDDVAESNMAMTLLKRRYTWQLAVATLLSTLSGKRKMRLVIRIERPSAD